jgi:hypothetical protein
MGQMFTVHILLKYIFKIHFRLDIRSVSFKYSLIKRQKDAIYRNEWFFIMYVFCFEG